MIQALENGEKPRFGPDLDPLGLKSGRVFFFFFPKLWLCQTH